MSETNLVLRGVKNAGIILAITELYGLPIRNAASIYYKSETSALIEEGVADLQCRSDKYLATLVWEEYNEHIM